MKWSVSGESSYLDSISGSIALVGAFIPATGCIRSVYGNSPYVPQTMRIRGVGRNIERCHIQSVCILLTMAQVNLQVLCFIATRRKPL